MATLQGAFSNTGYLGTRIDFSETGTNVANNTSTVHVNFYIISLNNGYTTSQVTNIRNVNVTVNGETKSASVPAWTIARGEVWHVASFDFTVPHNPDGTKTVSVSSSYDPQWGIGSSSLSGSLKLTNIPRASSVSCSDFYIESSTTININSANSAFRHTLKYSFGGLSGTIVEKTALTSYGWTPNASQFYSKIPNAMQGTGTITCETYNGNTLLGTKTCNFTARVDKTKNIPNVSLAVADTNEVTKELTGSENTLVKYFSNAKVTITANAKNSSTIKYYQINNVNAQQISTINNVEINEFTAKVFDSRGIDGSSTKVTKNFIDYVKLAIKSATIVRTAPTEDQIRLNLNGFYFNGSFGAVANTLNLKIKYKEEYGEWSEYYSITPNISENNTFNLEDYNLNELFGNASFDYQKSYVFKFVVNDKLIPLNQEITLKKGLPVVAYGEDFVHVYGDLEVDGKYYNVFPIGSIYMSVNNVNPSNLFGGTWEQLKDRFLLGAGDTYKAGTIGGENEHVLTKAEIPNHTHLRGYSYLTFYGSDGAGVATAQNFKQSGSDGQNFVWEDGGQADGVRGQPHNNMPPYLTVYIWKRIA